ncbi:MAG: alpha/beta fold hydrolase [Acidobacteria bacterium]|nr:alpha/beta fold hydrolase [Acidobacteriota bacterium]
MTAAPRRRQVFYLHGFASSPNSTKVGYFRDRFGEHGIELRCPDLNEPEFATLTLTRMLDQLGAELAMVPAAATLIGSSLGGTLAVLAAAKYPGRVERLVLLAPAVMFAKS